MSAFSLKTLLLSYYRVFKNLYCTKIKLTCFSCKLILILYRNKFDLPGHFCKSSNQTFLTFVAYHLHFTCIYELKNQALLSITAPILFLTKIFVYKLLSPCVLSVSLGLMSLCLSLYELFLQAKQCHTIFLFIHAIESFSHQALIFLGI